MAVSVGPQTSRVVSKRSAFGQPCANDEPRRLDLRAAAYTGLRLPTLNELYRPFVVFPVTTRANAALANPTRFIALAGAILPWLATLTALCLAAGIYMSFATEGDYQQGETVKIMFIHVPVARGSLRTVVVGSTRSLKSTSMRPSR